MTKFQPSTFVFNENGHFKGIMYHNATLAKRASNAYHWSLGEDRRVVDEVSELFVDEEELEEDLLLEINSED